MQNEADGSAPRWTLAGLIAGARMTAAIVPATAVFGLGFGAAAAQKGLSFFNATLMSATVMAGASQFVALEIWREPMTLTLAATVALVAGVVNMRLLLMSASMRPWLGALPAWQVYPALLTMTDASWMVSVRAQAQGHADASVLLGSGLLLWSVWVTSTMAGFALGAVVADPARFGLDLILPIFFTAMLVPMWRGSRRALAWGIAALVALGVQYAVPGYWYMVAGAVAGSIAGGFIDDDAAA